MTQNAEQGTSIRLPDNPVHRMRSCQLAAREIRARVGEDHYKSDFAWNLLRDKWLLLREDLVEFVSGSGGVLVKNHKNLEWFSEKESSPTNVNVLEKKRYVYQLDGRERVLMLDQLLDLERLIGRQLVDIRRSLSKHVSISPEFALLRGLATAKAAGFTADIDRLKVGQIVHRFRENVVISITDGLIDWLKSNGFDEVPTPDSYSSFAFLQSFRQKTEDGWIACPVPRSKVDEESGSAEDSEDGLTSAPRNFDGRTCAFCKSKSFDLVTYDDDDSSGLLIGCTNCGASWEVIDSEGVRRFHLRSKG